MLCFCSFFYLKLFSVPKVWFGAVLPLVEDRENSVQEKALKSVSKFVLDRLAACIKVWNGKLQNGTREQNFSSEHVIWDVLNEVDEEIIRCLQISVSQLHKRKQLSRSFVKALSSVCAADEGAFKKVQDIHFIKFVTYRCHLQFRVFG